MKKKIFLSGINCLNCAKCVSEALKNIGAKDVEVSYIKGFATVDTVDGTTDELIKLAIEDAGYEVVLIE